MGFGVTLGSLYIDAEGYVPVLLENLCGMSCSGTFWPLGSAWFQCRYMPANLENSAVVTGLENFSFHFNPKERHVKECSNYCTVALISHASKVMLKILQARLQQYVNCELLDVQACFRKAEEPEIKLPTSARSWKNKRVPEKHLFLLY